MLVRRGFNKGPMNYKGRGKGFFFKESIKTNANLEKKKNDSFINWFGTKLKFKKYASWRINFGSEVVLMQFTF